MSTCLSYSIHLPPTLDPIYYRECIVHSLTLFNKKNSIFLILFLELFFPERGQVQRRLASFFSFFLNHGFLCVFFFKRYWMQQNSFIQYAFNFSTELGNVILLSFQLDVWKSMHPWESTQGLSFYLHRTVQYRNEGKVTTCYLQAVHIQKLKLCHSHEKENTRLVACGFRFHCSFHIKGCILYFSSLRLKSRTRHMDSKTRGWSRWISQHIYTSICTQHLSFCIYNKKKHEGQPC